MRITNIANFDLWSALSKEKYLEEKEQVYQTAKKILKSCGVNSPYEVLFKDIFTPTTVKKYTSHFKAQSTGPPKRAATERHLLKTLTSVGPTRAF